MNNETVKKYIVTKEECEKNISGVCEGCGGPLSAIETVDNSNNPTFWQGCVKCCSFRSGADPLYFKIARKLVEEERYLQYSHMKRSNYEDTPENLEYYLSAQTAGMTRIIHHIHQLIKKESV